MWSSLFTLALGAGGWWISKFLFEPLKEIYDLRRDVQECLIIHGDLSKDAPEEQRVAAATTFSRLGAGLVARDLAAYSWVRWFCRKVLRLDIYSAGGLLIGIGNEYPILAFQLCEPITNHLPYPAMSASSCAKNSADDPRPARTRQATRYH